MWRSKTKRKVADPHTHTPLPHSPSHPLTLLPSRPPNSHPLTLSPSHPLTSYLSPSQLSPSQSLTLSPSQPLTLSVSHPLTSYPLASHLSPSDLSPSLGLSEGTVGEKRPHCGDEGRAPCTHTRLSTRERDIDRSCVCIRIERSCPIVDSLPRERCYFCWGVCVCERMEVRPRIIEI